MIFRLLLLAFVVAASAFAEEEKDRASVLIAVGASGEQTYSDAFAHWAADWERACDAGGAKHLTIGLGRDGKDATHATNENGGGLSDHDRIKAALDAEPRESANELWIVLLGHGTADAKDAKFNLRGDDLAASELAAWLKPFRRTVIVICAFSSSGAWLKPLAGPDRITVTATKSGSENNYARFGGHLAQAIGDPGADFDKDGETSLLEAWLTAARKTADFYKDEGRLATEHSLLDDNGDGLGTPPDWFSGVRVVKKSRDGSVPDGRRAAQIHLVRSAAERALTAGQRAERDALERDLGALRERKATMKEDDYFRELEILMLRIARIYLGGG
jgi:mannose-6-phosphate isomerase-like protein (cupin superfamily)